MGRILFARCTNCSYSLKLSFGGGRRDHMVNLPVPAMEIDSRMIKSVNYLESKDDPRYQFYCDPKLKGNLQDGSFETQSLKINFQNNYCPACDSFNLCFESVGMYD